MLMSRCARQVVSGNYVTGKRRGVVEGVDFGAPGKVRFLQPGAVRAQLEQGHIVLLNSLAFSASGARDCSVLLLLTATLMTCAGIDFTHTCSSQNIALHGCSINLQAAQARLPVSWDSAALRAGHHNTSWTFSCCSVTLPSVIACS